MKCVHRRLFKEKVSMKKRYTVRFELVSPDGKETFLRETGRLSRKFIERLEISDRKIEIDIVRAQNYSGISLLTRSET
jgi:hypothetical protein